jgi:hypothetical protein
MTKNAQNAWTDETVARGVSTASVGNHAAVSSVANAVHGGDT